MSVEVPQPPKLSPLMQAYESLCRPDRPADADRDRKPVLAAVLSLLIAGAGQLYNRQLFKALVVAVAVYLVCGILLVVWLLLHWLLPETGDGWGMKIGRFFLRLGLTVPIVGGGLWLFSIIEAFRTAAALRAGRIVVRFSFKKQLAMTAATFVPAAGLIVPSETCSVAETAGMSEAELARHIGVTLVKNKAMSIGKIILAVIGLVPLIAGAILGLTWLVVVGACVILVGLILFLL
jgi:TM2 domain-containing membrane protein YozV